MLQRWKKNSKKGFTLVELIVVLVIPALTGYIDKAKEKQIIAETRQVVMAAQTLVDEVYGTIDLNSVGTANIEVVEAIPATPTGLEIKKEDIAKLAEVPDDNITSVDINKNTAPADTDMPGIVTKVVYERDGKTCTYTKTSKDAAGTYEITETPSP